MSYPSDAREGMPVVRVVILTSDSLRHRFFRMRLALSDGLEVVRSFCEADRSGLPAHLSQAAVHESVSLRERHLRLRDASEEDFFGEFVRLAPDQSHPQVIPRGEVNSPRVFEEIRELDPGLVICYGASIIRDPLLSEFSGRFLNVHLGLSPYYRGSGTNLWALVDGRPEAVGVTFMHIDAGIDTGLVVHQVRARVVEGDGPHQIGNRLIVDAAAVCADLAQVFPDLEDLTPLPEPASPRVCRRSDFSEASVRELYRRFEEGMIDRYTAAMAERVAALPILKNPAVAFMPGGT